MTHGRHIVIDGAGHSWSALLMTDELAELFENHFHGAALQAIVEQARQQQGWPCPQATRQLAYRYYEEELAGSARNG